MSKKMTILTSEDRDTLLSKSAYVLPDNPSSKQFSAGQIKRKMYEPLIILLDWLKGIIEENNENVELNDAEIERIHSLIDDIKSGEIIAGKANADSKNNVIYEHYETKGDAVTKKEEILAIISQLENLVVDKDNATNEKLNQEISRATNAEDELDTKITIEKNRAIGIENSLDTKIEVSLDEAKDYADGLVSKAYKTKGSVQNYSDLPSNPEIGDVYNILNASPEHNITAGENVVWNGTQWDELGGVFDTTKIDREIHQLQKDVKYLSTGGIISTAYDDSTGEMTLELADGADAQYDDSTGMLTVRYE